MTIVLAHNFYLEPGGEDQVFAAESELLRATGHRVILFEDTNQRTQGMNRAQLLHAAVWNRQMYSQVAHLVHKTGADIVHFHNTFPLLSPSCYSAARLGGAAVVQTLHNYRLLCPGATFFRAGSTCQDCLGHSLPWPGVLHACYRQSRAATAGVAIMLSTHRLRGTWRDDVDVYVALSEFSRRQFIAGGLPEHKIVVKPNFVHPDPGPGIIRERFGLYVGRLSSEKGIETLIRAWAGLPLGYQLKVIGDGPLTDSLRELTSTNTDILWLGRQPRIETLRLMQQAFVLVAPSLCWEHFPMVVAEACSTGLPVIASDNSNMAGLVEDGVNGLTFCAGDDSHLRERLLWAFSHPESMAAMGHASRLTYQTRYNAESALQALEHIYHRALAEAASRS